MLRSNQIISKLKENRKELSEIGVERIGLFGSYVRNEQKEDSDLDIIVSFKTGEARYKNLYRLHELLRGIFDLRVEIVTIESLSPYIGPYILKEAKFIETT